MPRSELDYDERPPRRMSVDSNRSRERDDVEEPVPAKRMRTDTRTEDKARSKRLFGNLLGTLQKFQKDDKSSRKTEKVKRREEVAERIQAKIRTETTLHHDIAESERELKTLRIQTESSEFILKHKSVAMSARHATLKPISRFLHTSLPTASTPLFEGNLLNPAPIPLNQGPTREPPHPDDLKPLYFLPKILLPHQQDTLDTRIANIDELIADEQAALEKEKEEVTNTARKNRLRIAELGEKLADLRSQVKPAAGRSETDELGRMPREEMDVDREAGVQITGEDGDVEVEY